MVIYYIKEKDKCFSKEIEFEGEYISGDKIWKGKEYFNEKLEYEGEFKNDKRNGYGKEYEDEGFLVYEGE